jgi:predicted SAM-dependent methyltransferase
MPHPTSSEAPAPATRRLHIGGRLRAAGWEVLDAIAAPHVDHVGDARDLSRFADSTFAALYASHVLEHFDYRSELPAALREWHRVLSVGGKLYVSVPDLDILARLFLLREQLSLQERYEIMRMIFGGQTHDFDYHYVGLNEEFLTAFLTEAGFTDLRRVPSFGLFGDTSAFQFRGVPISLNVIAEKR